MPIWHRHSDSLIELTLTSTEAEPNEQRWTLRLEGETLELKSLNDEGAITAKIRLVRSEGRIVVAENE
jgi:hypothetical protein